MKHTDKTLDDKLVFKIQKLLDKAESTDLPKEAELYFAKAQQLMREHGIDMMRLRESQDKKTDEDFTCTIGYSRAKLEPWERMLAEAIGIACGVRILYYSPPKASILFIGFELDVTIAVAMYPRLRKTAMSFAAKYVKEENERRESSASEFTGIDFIRGVDMDATPKKVKLYGLEWRSFVVGFMHGLFDIAQYEKAMADQNAQNETDVACNALIIKKDNEVAAYLERQFPDVKKAKKAKTIEVDGYAMRAGQRAADKVQFMERNKLDG